MQIIGKSKKVRCKHNTKYENDYKNFLLKD